MSSTTYRLCQQRIKFDDKRVSQRTGKKIPLDVATNEPHDCPVRRDNNQPQQQGQQLQQQPQTQPQQRRYMCNKGCGQEIYFHDSQRTENGKWIPLDRQTGEPHRCQ